MTDLTGKQILDAMRESVKEAARVAGSKRAIKKRPLGANARKGKQGASLKPKVRSRARGK